MSGVAPRRVRVDVAYDGTGFAGWQRQTAQRTVQGELESVLSRIAGNVPVTIHGAGRTDAGVHARQQVLHCDLSTDKNDRDLHYAMRRLLPEDLRVTRVRTVDGQFDARRTRHEKTYVYRLDLSPGGDPFARRFAWHYVHPIDRAVVDRALAKLPGTRDWSGFTAARCTIVDRVRTLSVARLEWPAPTAPCFRFRGNGFLRYMVRNLVGTLVEIGGGKLPEDRLEQILETRDRALGGATAPAHALCLESIRYPGEPEGEQRRWQESW